MSLLIEIAGWTGSALILLAYGLNSYKKIQSDSVSFYFMNFVGGLLLIVYTIYKGAFANTFINIAWVIIAIPALIKSLRSKNNKA